MELSIIEFAEKVCKSELTQNQKYFLRQIEDAHKNNKKMYISMPPRCGRKQIKDIMEKYLEFLSECSFCRYIPNANFNEELESPCLAIKDNEMCVYFNGLDVDFYIINYCPKCGRRLVE